MPSKTFDWMKFHEFFFVNCELIICQTFFRKTGNPIKTHTRTFTHCCSQFTEIYKTQESTPKAEKDVVKRTFEIKNWHHHPESVIC